MDLVNSFVGSLGEESQHRRKGGGGGFNDVFGVISVDGLLDAWPFTQWGRIQEFLDWLKLLQEAFLFL